MTAVQLFCCLEKDKTISLLTILIAFFLDRLVFKERKLSDFDTYFDSRLLLLNPKSSILI